MSEISRAPSAAVARPEPVGRLRDRGHTQATPTSATLRLVQPTGDRIAIGRPTGNDLATARNRMDPLPTPAIAAHLIVHHFAGHGSHLITTPQAAAAIAHGDHQIDVVAGARLAYPSQNLVAIESTDFRKPGQTHVVHRHIGSDLAANVARLRAEPRIRAAGSYTDLAAAQFATDETIANPANQRFIADFLADGSRSKDILERVELGRAVGTSTLRRDLIAGQPSLRTSTTADVVIVKDASFPEGYRVLTSYPEATRGAQVDANGRPL